MTVRHPINRGALKAYTLRTPRTAAEIAAGVTPVDDNYEPGHVLRYGPNTTPGTTDMTVAVQAAIDSGSNPFAHPGTYACDLLTIDNKTDLHFLGYGATIRWRNQGVLENLDITGTCSNITIEGLTFKGDDVTDVNNPQIGVRAPNGATTIIDNIKVVNCRFENLTQGVFFNLTTAGTARDLRVTGCSFYEMAGTAAGSGYGVAINVANAIGMISVTDNYFENCHRHSIYFAQGANGLISNNRIYKHRNGDSDLSFAAIMVARSKNVDVIGNIIREGVDTAIMVAPATTAEASVTDNINIIGNIVTNNAAPDLLIGSGAPATSAALQNITVHGNTFIRESATNFEHIIELRHSLGCKISDNVFNCPKTYASLFNAIQIFGFSETSGTTLYTDDIIVSNNVFTQDGTNSRPILIDDLAANSGIIMRFDGNIFSGVGGGANEFYIPGTTHSNANIRVTGQRARGLTVGDWIFPNVATLDDTGTPSVAGNTTFNTSGTTTITDLLNGTAGQIVTIFVNHSVTFDVTGTNLGGGTVDIACAGGDLISWACENGTLWSLVGFMDQSVDNSAGA